MSFKLLITASALAVISSAQSVGAPASTHTPDAVGIESLLNRGGDAARVIAARCELRPSQLFGPNVYRCEVRLSREAEAASPARLNLTVVSHDGGWVIVGR